MAWLGSAQLYCSGGYDWRLGRSARLLAGAVKPIYYRGERVMDFTPSNRRTTLIIALAVWLGVIAATQTVSHRMLAAQESPQAAEFPAEFLHWIPDSHNPIFTGAGPDHWDVKIRERGWILREGDAWSLWYTGYDGTKTGRRMLGYATSSDGLSWTRFAQHPLDDQHWIEDVQVLKVDDVYYMFAEGLNDQAQLLVSKDKVHWQPRGTLDIRYTNGKPITPGPFGTPTAFYENKAWYLFYERSDQGIWLAKSTDLAVWHHVQDEPVIGLGPNHYDAKMIAMNQVLKHDNKYYAMYHGSGSVEKPSVWTTNLAVSSDLIHWKKYPGNPLLPEKENKSSGILVNDGKRYRLYTMHDTVQVHFPK
ncbi:MAG: glycosylase [Planctomycetaceae bacterium]|nr:glycosylase [Planctomycetaceae bacterium]